MTKRRLKDRSYYGPQTGRRRFNSSTRALSSRQVYSIVAQEINILEEKINKITNQLIDGEKSFEGWQKDMATLVRNGHVNLLRLGRGDAKNTFAIHYLETGRRLKDLYYPALVSFSSDIKDQKISKAQIVARARLYARSTRDAFEYGRLTLEESLGKTQAKRLLGACAPHCDPCIEYSQRGYVSLSEVILPTRQCDCRANCCCTLQYI